MPPPPELRGLLRWRGSDGDAARGTGITGMSHSCSCAVYVPACQRAPAAAAAVAVAESAAAVAAAAVAAVPITHNAQRGLGPYELLKRELEEDFARSMALRETL